MEGRAGEVLGVREAVCLTCERAESSRGRSGGGEGMAVDDEGK